MFNIIVNTGKHTQSATLQHKNGLIFYLTQYMVHLFDKCMQMQCLKLNINHTDTHTVIAAQRLESFKQVQLVIVRTVRKK